MSTEIIPYRGLIMVKPLKDHPVSRVVTMETVLADRSGNTKNMPGTQNVTLQNELHFIKGEVLFVGLGYPAGPLTEKQIPGMDPIIPREIMDTKEKDVVFYAFNNPLNPVYELELNGNIVHLMREDAVITIFRN